MGGVEWKVGLKKACSCFTICVVWLCYYCPSVSIRSLQPFGL
jgi:hypothetical protein